jgi:Flp pilus assembly protein TadB
VTRFARFWWNFVVGDDWRVAVGVALAIVAVAVLHHEHVAAWWVLPLAVLLVLYLSLRRAARA